MADKPKKRSTMNQLVLSARAGRTSLSAKLSELEIYPGQDAVLLALGDHDGMSLRDLAARLAVRPPTITKTVARLIAQGLIEKRSSETDARQSHAFLSEKGRALVDEVRAAQKAVERSALKGLSDKERKTLRKLLQRVEKNLATAGRAAAEAAAAPATPSEDDE
ncbi:MarR family transcriptional regulator [Aurantimonas sp. MSK8Z-1]|uniref:MarR family winged helix-turn-helix transcriptional regulator n=1 Tax=Mangrovibrevibacter kandeliae TaxID=2968473 RepID=UPI00211880F4|nr:MarR family transcriptional regulator [Aurantimonas sp. MSK8Z-1]MCW4115332.1 MarR family transcriptional regulator [Aurantimonas sp. MSK8Z-1]